MTWHLNRTGQKNPPCDCFYRVPKHIRKRDRRWAYGVELIHFLCEMHIYYKVSISVISGGSAASCCLQMSIPVYFIFIALFSFSNDQGNGTQSFTNKALSFCLTLAAVSSSDPHFFNEAEVLKRNSVYQSQKCCTPVCRLRWWPLANWIWLILSTVSSSK